MNFVSFWRRILSILVYGVEKLRVYFWNVDEFLKEDNFSRLKCIPFCNNNLIFHFFDTKLEQVRLSTL